MRSNKLLVVMFASLAVVCVLAGTQAWAGTETVLFTFNGADGEFPRDYGLLARDSSGNFYGTTDFGGACGTGTVFQLAGSVETVLHSFCGSDGSRPFGAVILDGHGAIYGTTYIGGTDNCGTVFQLSGTQLTTLYNFTCGSDGGNPWAGLVRDARGNLYGTASLYGANAVGVAFEISNTGTFSVIYQFCSATNCDDGSYPSGAALTLARNGDLYGMTSQGGVANRGAVFRLSQSSGNWKATVLHSFSGGSNDGSSPSATGLTLAQRTIGNKMQTVIQGVTSFGGTADQGVVFQLANSSGRYVLNVLHSFDSTTGDGSYPVGTLTSVNGKLFGTTSMGGGSHGGGIVFELTETNHTWNETILYSFTGGTDGNLPFSGVLAGADGNLYGVTNEGGTGTECFGVACGVIYEVTP